MSDNEDELTDAQLWELTTSDNPTEKADACLELAGRMWRREQVSDGVSLAATAYETFQSIDAEAGEAVAAFTYAKFLLELDRADEVIPVIKRAIELYRVYHTEEMLADALVVEARAQQSLDHNAEAIEAWNSAIGLYDNNDRKTSAGICALDKGEMLGFAGQQDEALASFHQALSIFKSGADLIGSGRAHDRIAAALIDLGDIPEAIVHLREGLFIFDYLQDESRLPWAQYRLGWTLVTYGDYHEAIPLLETASAAYKNLKRFTYAASADTQLAHALAAVGREDEAIYLYRQTRAVYDAAGDTHNALVADVNAAYRLVYTDFEEAIRLLKRVLKGAEEIDDSWLLRVTRVRLAEALFKRDNEESYAEALELVMTDNPDDAGLNLDERIRHTNAIAYALVELNRDEEAKAWLKQAIDLGFESGFAAQSAEAYRLMALIERDAGNTDVSNQLLSQAIAMFLSAGEDEKARGLSRRFLPDFSAQRQDILQPSIESQAGNSSHEDDTDSANN